MQKVNTLAQLQSLLNLVVDTTSIDHIPIDLRTDDLSSEQMTALRTFASESCTAFVLDADEEMIDFLFKFEIATDQEPALVTAGGKRWASRRNLANRLVNDSKMGPATKAGTHSSAMVSGQWCLSPDPIVISQIGILLSGQHRGGAVKIAFAAGLERIQFVVLLNYPNQLRDLLDKGRTRAAKDDDFCDYRVMSQELIDSLQVEETEIKEKAKERELYVKARNTVNNDLLQRLSGSDVHAGGGAWSNKDRIALGNRFVQMSVTMHNILTDSVVVHDVPELEKLIVMVHESTKDQKGKRIRPWTTVFSPNLLAVALVLESNGQEAFEAFKATIDRSGGESVEAYAQRLQEEIHVRLTGELTIDWEFAGIVLDWMVKSTDQSGPLATLFNEILSTSVKEAAKVQGGKYSYKPYSEQGMAMLVDALKQIREMSATLDEETGEIVLQDFASVWITKKEKKVADAFRCFGGLT